MEALQSTTEIRHPGAGDSQDLTRLAALDTADPFRPTADIRALLAHWARMLQGRRRQVRRKRLDRAARAHRLRASGVRFVPGSEHTHLLQRPRGF